MNTLHTPGRFRPVLHSLEARVNPATFTVTTLADDGSAGSLRSLVRLTDTLAGADDIVFDTSLAGTLTLTGAINVNDTLSIRSPFARDVIAISGGDVDRIFLNSSPSLTLENLTLTRGFSSADGGAIANDGALFVVNCVIFDNVATTDGGAINSSFTGTTVDITNSWITGNSAANGGGISARTGSVVVVDSTISANIATTGDGGGIYTSGASNLTVVQSTLSGNTAGNDGGGIHIDISGVANVTNSTIAQNVAGTSTAVGYGGGINVFAGATNVQSTIVATNDFTGSGQGPDLRGTFQSVEYSIIGQQTADVAITSTTGSFVGDPIIGSLAFNGGLNPTHRLLLGSPAINGGLSRPAGFETGSDQRGNGFARNYANRGVDIGAVEFGSGNGIERIAVGSDQGIDTVVRIYDGAGTLLTTIAPYGVGFRGGVRVGTGDFTGDGVQDIVTAAGVGGGPNVKIFDGVTFAELNSFYAYNPFFNGGVFFGIADVNADGVADIATAAGPGGGPHVQVIDGTKLGLVDGSGQITEGALLASFFAFEPAFTGGVTIASGDFNGDGNSDLALAAGPGAGPRIRVIDGTLLTLTNPDGQISESAGLIGAPTLESGESLASFYAFGDPFYTGGVVLTAGDIDGDGLPDLMYGDATRSTRVQIRNAFDGIIDANFFAFESSYPGGVRLAAADNDGDGSAESVVIGRGPGGPSQVRIVRGNNPGIITFDQEVFPGFSGGVFVG